MGLVWQNGIEDGGSPVIDFKISYDEGRGDHVFVELINGLTTTSYTASGLTRGTTYQFKVQSRNAYGESGYSTRATILAA